MPANSKDAAAVIRWRQRLKAKLVVAFGGKCGICGYSKSPRALTFHHLDATTKEFHFSHRGIPRSWKRVVDEAKKCVMLCHNCHAEVHDGVAQIPENIQRFVEPIESMPMRHARIRPRKTADPANFRPRRDRPMGKVLREMVRLSSRVAVAKKFGVSETAVRKWLKTDSLNGVY